MKFSFIRVDQTTIVYQNFPFVYKVKVSDACIYPTPLRGWGTCGVIIKNVGLRILSKQVRTPVALLRSLSGKYSWERYEPPYPSSYGLNSATTVLL